MATKRRQAWAERVRHTLKTAELYNEANEPLIDMGNTLANELDDMQSTVKREGYMLTQTGCYKQSKTSVHPLLPYIHQKQTLIVRILTALGLGNAQKVEVNDTSIDSNLLNFYKGLN